MLAGLTLVTVGAGSGPDVLLRFGALRGDLVWERGEWWRLATAPWLHAGLIHLFFNGSALLQLGALVERLHGTGRMLAVYFVSAWAGSLLSAWGTVDGARASVGASGAILGLAGFLLVQSWTAAPAVRLRLRELLGGRLLASVLLTFALGVGLALLVPVVDNLAHLGGLLGGGLFGLAWRHPRRNARSALAAVATTLTLVAAVLAGLRGGAATATLDADTARAMLRAVQSDPNDALAGIRLAEAARSARRAGLRVEDVLPPVLAGLQDPQTPALAVSVLYEGGEHGGQDDTALQLLLERWVELAPRDPVATNALAWNLLHRHPAEAARAEPLAVIALRATDPADDAMVAQVADTYAEALRQLGRLVEARDQQRVAVRAARAGAPDLLPVLLPRLAWLETAALDRAAPR